MLKTCSFLNASLTMLVLSSTLEPCINVCYLCARTHARTQINQITWFYNTC
uniref:Uncharacterized protein n=1 Tax=Anguilla anguilla TaxID=7936 RepID=A0A0E9VD46_ANGAN